MGKYQGTLSGTFIWGGEIGRVKGDWSTFLLDVLLYFLKKLFLNKESKKESPGK